MDSAFVLSKSEGMGWDAKHRCRDQPGTGTGAPVRENRCRNGVQTRAGSFRLMTGSLGGAAGITVLCKLGGHLLH